MTWAHGPPGENRMAARSPLRTPVPAVEILLVEDSRDDAELMVEALTDSDLAVRVTVVEDGEDAVRYLRREGGYQDAPRPDLVLLDLHLPRKSGHEVLEDIKQDESLRLIPVVLLTAFASDEAIEKAHDRHVNCCVRKPSDLDELAQAVCKIKNFWLRMVRRPHQP
jgi:CheY-like chemotaxis protein